MNRLPVPAGSTLPANPVADEVVYEVECILDPEVVAEFDAWVPGHVRDVMRSPGFLSAETFRPAEPGADGRVRRVNRYRVRDRAALDHYLENLAPALREDGARRFAGRARYERRVLAPLGRYGTADVPAACANCGIALVGPYCSECGQHARESARSMGALFHDAWHTLTHVDGRFWQTLRNLLLKPGFLTSEYFAERRARYVPPFRLYLIMSLLFFGLASLSNAFGGSDGEEAFRADPPAAEKRTANPVATVASAASDARTQFQSEFGKAMADVRRDMAAEEAARRAAAQAAPAAAAAPAPTSAPVDGAPRAATDQPAAIAKPAAAPAGATAGEAPADGDAKGNYVFFGTEDCERLTVTGSKWLEDTLRIACRRQARDGGKTLGHAFVANIPKMMFVFLPLMAAAMLLLYWFPRRYYVEHLVFYLHVHAGLFLALVILILLGLVARVIPVIGPAVAFAGLAAFFYAAWYVYRAMRVHYRNGRWLTILKYCVIGIFYSIFLSITLLGTALVSALTA